ncbi:hypothetical protein CcaverHIS002_0402380 [Cutaneotrichosporon cavernicola]|uniref:Chitin synthase export chaperone n=1 Tax=Cutaneotrichosporon cavernicola TaxID=279322 RepID=A0AA48L3S3_9TREE|nr:uncharacterized protein CcaverHIS019_0402350 [Cutaneotrichosporon cavernicola]BEI83634.1 hypothetical protein CcaverHIS002_0402380 [Cutaneotrichosporon cavernicola]BEI91415.1 hypothetical protein CcaverHIS019_0402350 [Cutaneotrichosporon cavernicola]BEI99188.1 hypothetical protein CcaverHIS631_0402310 [Cutaneotrichosporon cavernicola]BEJ06965.1 hypothetical protein CcaverHIS641_0402340 [Cutaneotrichosporon cavernicola]
MTLTSTAVLAAAFLAHQASAQQYCRDRFGNIVRCRSGLSMGARIAIGVCVGVGIFIIFMAMGMMRRRKLQNQWNQYRPPPPVGMTGDPSMPQYANNPPPPTYAADGGFRSDNVDGPAPPPAVYQPSSAGQYGMGPTNTGGANSSYYGADTNTNPHNYEYEQQARMDAEKDQVPGYSVDGGYASPSGPPPAAGGYASPDGPPPGAISASTGPASGR